MSADILFYFEDDPLEEAERIMRERHVHRLAALERADQHLPGIIALTALSGGGSERRPYEFAFQGAKKPSSSKQISARCAHTSAGSFAIGRSR
jgi:CBS domain-containing protein